MVRLLFSIGAGYLILGFVVAICSLVQQRTSPVELDVINILKTKGQDEFAHVRYLRMELLFMNITSLKGGRT